MGVEESNKPIIFKMGQRFEYMNKICPNCKEGELSIDKMRNIAMCISCGFEIDLEEDSE